jgi:MoaA/NifB/PqqE/SkfB family radical SAM enzyme
MKKILRVFPDRTSMTPQDDMVIVGSPLLPILMPDADEVHISCIFTWDKGKAENLKHQYESYYPIVKIGGPAYGPGEDKFTAGMYIRKGVTITTRGCNMNCSYCQVNRIEGKFREINIEPGHIIQDNNILLSSKKHLNKVFEMLKTQHAIEFKGGIDSRLLKDWHIDALKNLKIKELWMALDNKERMPSFEKACKKLVKAGFYRNQIRVYILAGHNEEIQASEERLEFAYKCGALPYIQVYQEAGPENRFAGEICREDNLFVRKWSRPAAMKNK